MTDQTRRECIKALAYGYSRDAVCTVMNVSKEEVIGITDKEIDTQRNYLRSMGYIQ